MERTLRSLLREVIDYAGMFPPARLPLEQAFQKYAAYRQEDEAWMLSRFIAPAGQLEAAAALIRAHSASEPCRLSVVGSQDPLTPEFARDVRAVTHLLREVGDAVRVEALELKIPRETLEDWDSDVVAEGFNVLADRLLEHGLNEAEVFVEPVFGSDWNASVERVVAALQRHDQDGGKPAPARIGFKLRTGGMEAAAFPTAEQVSFALATCRDADIPLKFTAGLHHPLHHYSEEVSTDMHGFLNVFLAGAFAHVRGLEQQRLRDLLLERDAGAFQFSDGGVRWQDLDLSLDDIETARSEFVLSFGSCSFDEPRDDLRKLGLL
jgi:hypothetical protein